MARLVVSLFGVFATVVALGVPAHGVVAAPVPPQDFVVGSGERAFFLPDVAIFFSIDAHSDPLGGNPSGTVSIRIVLQTSEVHIGGPVTCLGVSGKRAVIGFLDRTTTGVPGTVIVLDAGQDEFEAMPQATDCSAETGFQSLPIRSGDIVVRDAPSKDQCRDGGWRNYTDAAGQPFKSQGECIAFALGTA
jgi:hypothetical protein